MTAYELMIKTNDFLIKGGELSEKQKEKIVCQLLAARSAAGDAQRFYRGVRLPDNRDSEGRQMYPIFYIPPYNNNKKYPTVMGLTPKTHILSANAFELEILRLLCLFAPDNPEVGDMTAKTLARLKTTCFGNSDDGVGGCFAASLIVLRYLATAAPDEKKWMQERVDNFNRHFAEKRRHSGVQWYYYLCLSELPFDIALPEILRYKDVFVHQLTSRSCVMNSEQDKANHPVAVCLIRNILARLPEYAYIKNREPFISEKDGRLHFDMTSLVSI